MYAWIHIKDLRFSLNPNSGSNIILDSIIYFIIKYKLQLGGENLQLILSSYRQKSELVHLKLYKLYNNLSGSQKSSTASMVIYP